MNPLQKVTVQRAKQGTALALLVLATLVLFSTERLFSQKKEDLLHWKTLSDDITPQQLRTERTDPQAIARRHAEAVREGRMPDLPNGLRVKRFVDPSRTPELLSLWEAFFYLAGPLDVELQSLLLSHLVDFGFEEEMAKTIADECARFSSSLAKKSADAGTVLEAFFQHVDALAEGQQDASQIRNRLERYAAEGNVKYLAQHMDISEDEANLFATAFSGQYSRELAEATLTQLESQLDADEWWLFRDYLLTYVQDSVGVIFETIEE